MNLVFWLSAAIIAYTYVGYPLAIAAFAYLRPRPWRQSPWSSSALPPVSIIMAVHNGAAMLAQKINDLLALDPSLIREIIIVSDGSSDATPTILRDAVDPRLHIVLLEQQAGKAVALNHGIALALGEILLFIDIRPRVNFTAISALLSNFADPHVGCVAGELLLTTDGHDATASAVSGLYWRYEQWIRNCEAAVDSPVGVYGGFYAVRRALASLIPAGTILDDMFQPLAIIRQGYRSVLDRTAFVTDTWPAKAAGEFQRKVRTLAGNFQLITRAPWMLTLQNRALFQLLSHKLLRLIVPYFLVLLLVSAIVLGLHSIPFALFAALQASLWLLAILALKVRLPFLHRLAAPLSALLVLNAAAVAGLYTFLFTQGPLWKIWSPTAAPADSQLLNGRTSSP